MKTYQSNLLFQFNEIFLYIDYNYCKQRAESLFYSKRFRIVYLAAYQLCPRSAFYIHQLEDAKSY